MSRSRIDHAGVGYSELTISTVMAGLVPAIHVLIFAPLQIMDARHKAGHDNEGSFP
jgi:hypothetical protein